MSRLLRLRLHNPVNVTVVKSEMQDEPDEHSLFYEKSLAFVCERNMQIRIVEDDKNFGLKPSKLRGMNKTHSKRSLMNLNQIHLMLQNLFWYNALNHILRINHRNINIITYSEIALILTQET